jgi:hypothetical protein
MRKWKLRKVEAERRGLGAARKITGFLGERLVVVAVGPGSSGRGLGACALPGPRGSRNKRRAAFVGRRSQRPISALLFIGRVPDVRPLPASED